MAQATVTLKITPNELEIIDEALRMYAFANKHLGQDGYKHPLDGYQHQGGDVRRLSMVALKIRQDIGLKL